VVIVLSYPFSFGHCIVYISSIYGFWLRLWYLIFFKLFLIMEVKSERIFCFR
jgi:hypothetical protein